LAELIPDGAVVRGSVLRVVGEPGAGSTTVAFQLAAAFTAVGEWTAAIDLEGTLGALAASEAGVALERFAVVRRVPPARWAIVVAALLDGVSLVVAEVPRGVGLRDARRLVARARERESVLVAYETRVRWPGEARLVVHADGSAWEGLGRDAGYLTDRRLQVRVEGRGAATRPRVGELARAV
jgi:RecA/RadA recombinase